MEVSAMAKIIPQEELEALEAIVCCYPDGASLLNIASQLATGLPPRTLQYRLKYLVDNQRLIRQGEKRWARYYLSTTANQLREDTPEYENQPPVAISTVPISKSAAEIQQIVRQPVHKRKPVGYNRAFLESYEPNVSTYLSATELAHLHQIGTPPTGQQPAGTYAKQILNRLLIDLSFNSSRLEGNTYSLLDTKRLISFDEAIEGKGQLDAQMILNHKDAIEFMVESAQDIDFDTQTILSLHALLANNLLLGQEATGRLRRIAVGIGQSVYYPLEIPQMIEECFAQILISAAAITDPFEQAFFVMVQLPYLQPFEDVNKRVSRLAANIPLIRANLAPLSFVDVPTDSYTSAMLGIYELNNVDLLKELFIWAYERSAERYKVVQQVIGDPNPFVLKYRIKLREIINYIVLHKLNRIAAFKLLASWAKDNIPAADAEQFREEAENELLALHGGNFARFKIRPSEFEAWLQVWNQRML
tara:strand:+ start:745 stop:2169 length:1425 start_codon:yes stop_codon:yes gene_type:complete